MRCASAAKKAKKKKMKNKAQKNEESAGAVAERGGGGAAGLGVRNICVHKENVTPLKMDIAYAVRRDRITCLTGNAAGAGAGGRGQGWARVWPS